VGCAIGETVLLIERKSLPTAACQGGLGFSGHVSR